MRYFYSCPVSKGRRGRVVMVAMVPIAVSSKATFGLAISNPHLLASWLRVT